MQSVDEMAQATKQVLDGSIGVGAITLPLWVQYIQTSAGVLTVFGGLVLLGLRIAISWREWRSK